MLGIIRDHEIIRMLHLQLLLEAFNSTRNQAARARGPRMVRYFGAEEHNVHHGGIVADAYLWAGSSAGVQVIQDVTSRVAMRPGSAAINLGR